MDLGFICDPVEVAGGLRVEYIHKAGASVVALKKSLDSVLEKNGHGYAAGWATVEVCS